MRDILRTLPQHLQASWTPMPVKTFMTSIASTYCSEQDARPTMLRRIWSDRFQNGYMKLIEACASITKETRESVIGRIAARSAVTNHPDRVTGDAICNVGDRIIKSRKKLERDELFYVIKSFIDDQIRVPEIKLKNMTRSTINTKTPSGKPETVLKDLERVVHIMRHGL
jgi:hypothetical protein